MDFLNIKTELVEIPVVTIGSTLGQFYFPTQNFLRSKYIVSIETYNEHDITFAPSGNAVISLANMQCAFLTLYGQNPEAVDAQKIPSSGMGNWNNNLPLTTLHRTFNASLDPAVRDVYGLIPRQLVWEKSFVQLANGQLLGNAAPVSFLFQVGYIGNQEDAVG